MSDVLTIPCYYSIGFLFTIGLDEMFMARAGDYCFYVFLSALVNFWYTLSVNFSMYRGLLSLYCGGNFYSPVIIRLGGDVRE